jgi:hypothetical protein
MLRRDSCPPAWGGLSAPLKQASHHSWFQRMSASGRLQPVTAGNYRPEAVIHG